MDDERFDDEVRQKKPVSRIVLSDGREYTEEYIFNRILKYGVKELEMKEALYRLLTSRPLKVELSDRDVGETIDFEKFIRKGVKSRENSKEVKLEIDGISGDDPSFYDVLLKHGECITL